MTDPIRAALERLHQYSYMCPTHDTDEIVAAARAALASDGAAVPDEKGSVPTVENIMQIAYDYFDFRGNSHGDSFFATSIEAKKNPAQSLHDFARAVLARWGQASDGPASDFRRWSEGVCGDGAAILRDGVMMPIEEIVAELNRRPAPAPVPVSERLPDSGGQVMDVDRVPEPIQFYWKRQQLRECCLWLEQQGHPDLARSMHYQAGPKPLLPPEEG